MNIETVAIKLLKPAPYNPRKALTPDDAEWRKIERSINEFGLVEPIVWNKTTGHVVGGHQRLSVLRAQGAKEVQVSVVELDEVKERALNVALNKITGEWDESKLAVLLQSLDDDMAIATGFDMSEIMGLLQRLDAESALAPLTDVEFAAHDAREAGSTENVTLTYSVLPAQKKAIIDAIGKARLAGAADNAAGLTAIATAYLRAP